MKETAVEWLIEKYFGNTITPDFEYFVKKAKEMEKDQHKETFVEGLYCESGDSEEFEKYYNETFKNK